MKVKVEFDCTPEEMRRFMGLPDVTDFHDAMAEKMKEAMANAAPQFDMDSLMKMWMPMGGDNLADFQKSMWQAMMGNTSQEDD